MPEDGGSVEVCLITNVGSNEPVSVIISTVPKTASREFLGQMLQTFTFPLNLFLAGEDYAGEPQVVQIPASARRTQTCFEIEIVDDGDVESDEDFLVNFQLPVGSSAIPGSVNSTCVTITDSDEGEGASLTPAQ